MMNLGIYIHIPFCLKKCNYCDFVSFENGNISGYFEALEKEIELYSDLIKNRKIDSVFIGGGTPSAVNPCYIGEVLKKFNLSNDCEVTIETNPKTLTLEKLKNYSEMGINRISIGMQSMNDNELKILGRAHTAYDFLKSYELIVKSGFTNINIDTMFGIPGQNLMNFENTINEVKRLNPTHISSYSLIIEEGTPFYTMKLELPEEDEERKMYQYLLDTLNLYKRYEISNFSKKGYECRHNLKYWTMQDYLGVGLNSHSFIENKRFYNTDNLEEYITKLKNSEYPVSEISCENNDELIKDYVITGLRLSDGINIKNINNKFKIDFISKYKEVVDKYVKLKMLELKNGNLKFTNKGFSVSNYILSDFI